MDRVPVEVGVHLAPDWGTASGISGRGADCESDGAGSAPISGFKTYNDAFPLAQPEGRFLNEEAPSSSWSGEPSEEQRSLAQIAASQCLAKSTGYPQTSDSMISVQGEADNSELKWHGGSQYPALETVFSADEGEATVICIQAYQSMPRNAHSSVPKGNGLSLSSGPRRDVCSGNGGPMVSHRANPNERSPSVLSADLGFVIPTYSERSPAVAPKEKTYSTLNYKRISAGTRRPPTPQKKVSGT
ncbi:hypothetical protein BDK51DRAFT_43582 [Blyttiomyces helicus]|uniref:Uncharacterized protein n=1 Tax=Blyttiomyces helicus TaxID=388810 RepID=A0A4P9W2J8_9FUNG|nr:hypothetical protein BDK51DRAFT_43582 [Blyttiomyces helicus]|eukprot:RKO86364.1 hypothetical protein BDK51DRAFT_43582 [Blyttiomyces helicus]